MLSGEAAESLTVVLGALDWIIGSARRTQEGLNMGGHRARVRSGLLALPRRGGDRAGTA
jgi:hypothetical protein